MKELSRHQRYRARYPERVRAARQRYRAEHPEKRREARQRYRARYPEKRRHHRKLYKARKRGARVVSFSRAALVQKAAYHGHCCAYCGDPHEHWDHVKPLAAGGLHIVANLVPSCGRCNILKGAQWVSASWALAIRSESKG